MQQASVGGGCDEDSGAASPPATRSPASFAIKSEPVADKNDGGVRVKVEMPEPTEAAGSAVEVKGEPREDYQQRQLNSNDGYHYERNDKKPGYMPDSAPGQCQQPHQGYRPVPLPPNSFGFPPFYGHHHHHPAMMPGSFPGGGGRPSPDGSIGDRLKIAGDAHEQTVAAVAAAAAAAAASHVDRHVAAYGRMPPPIPSDGFLQEHHHRYDAGDFQHANPAAMPYPGFRPTMSRSPYGNHQNNSAYGRSAGGSGSGHYHPARQRKWSGAAFRGLHPPMPWPTWFFRPDLPLGAPLPTSHVPNSSNVPTSSPLPSRTHLDVPKGPEPPSNSNKVHGQTPTICTVSDTCLIIRDLILPTGP
ncbi:uncharacterized protein LOC105190052 [Harpegnathos saltator]|uniref:uncharacterized protein LOC105190052 n=1 Tax=Harpegnathos saltator TaxID=610380 RepID=UPI000DBEE2BF|nr:uncharacterized protein LOC105190052 [Harpegnathos saltator]